jgi:hypothetical protein
LVVVDLAAEVLVVDLAAVDSVAGLAGVDSLAVEAAEVGSAFKTKYYFQGNLLIEII